MLRVEVSQQGHPSQTYHFQKNRVEVGRGANCDLVLTAPGISTIHAHIVLSEGRCLVIDQNSTNGTYLHGAPIHGPTKVMPYEAVYICSYCLHIEVAQDNASIPVTNASPHPPASEPPMVAPSSAAPARPTLPETPAPNSPPHLKQVSAADHATTLPPKSEEESNKRSGAQRITVQPNPNSTGSGPQDNGIELRRWAVPAAPKYTTQDEQGLARVFAALAQPFVETNTLPNGDEATRAGLYALAQAQLSVNLSPQSSELGQGAERIVQALCGIGPLSEILRSGLLDKPGNELVARAFEPIRIRDHASLQDWQVQDSATLHPWALGFAAARLLGQPNVPQKSTLHRRLSNGLQLSYIPAQELQNGPLLMLHAAAPPAKSWDHYCSAHAIAAHTKSLLETAIAQGCPITVIESEAGPESLWNALQAYALEHSSLCHIGWSTDASLCTRAFNFCADASPSEQLRLCDQAQRLSLAPILAVDHPSQDCLRALLRGRSPATRSFWLRLKGANVDDDAALAAMQTQLKLQPQAAAGLSILVTRSKDATPGQISRIQEYAAIPGKPIQETLLLTRKDGQLLPEAPNASSFHSNAAQRSFTVAPNV